MRYILVDKMVGTRRIHTVARRVSEPLASRLLGSHSMKVECAEHPVCYGKASHQCYMLTARRPRPQRPKTSSCSYDASRLLYCSKIEKKHD